jgi:hypothetical protein
MIAEVRNTVRESLQAAGFKPQFCNPAISLGRGVREHMVDGLVSLEVLTQRRFRARFSAMQYGEALAEDWRMGWTRIARQDSAVEALLQDERSPSAWVLVSAYYSAYFSALAILRCLGCYPSYISDVDAAALLRAAGVTNGAVALDAGLYRVRCDVAKQSGEVVFTFQGSASGSHELVWILLREQLEELLKKQLKKSAKKSASAPSNNLLLTLISIVNGGEANWRLPSEVRNEWNYRNVRMYAEPENSDAKAVRALAKSHDKAIRWGSAGIAAPSREREGQAIAFLRSVLLRTNESIVSHP